MVEVNQLFTLHYIPVTPVTTQLPRSEFLSHHCITHIHTQIHTDTNRAPIPMTVAHNCNGNTTNTSLKFLARVSPNSNSHQPPATSHHLSVIPAASATYLELIRYLICNRSQHLMEVCAYGVLPQDWQTHAHTLSHPCACTHTNTRLFSHVQKHSLKNEYFLVKGYWTNALLFPL